MFPSLAQLPAYLRRAYEAFELAEANLCCVSSINRRTYYDARRELVAATAGAALFCEGTIERYLRAATLWHQVCAFGVYLERTPIPGTQLYTFHTFFDGSDGPMGIGHGHNVLLIDGLGEPVRVKWHRPAEIH